MATYGMFGWIFTIYRVVTSIVIAMFAGILTNIFDKDTDENTQAVKKATSSFSTVAPNKATTFTLGTPQEETCDSGTVSCCGSTCEENKKFSFGDAMKYAFITLLGDIAKPLFWGLLIGTLITVAIPDNLAKLLQDYSWLSYLIVIAIAIPMYVCATASLPIAAGLMLSGVSAGAAFVFLSAGPATNTVTIGVVKKMLGTRSLYIYLGSIIIGSVLFGLGLDYVFDSNSIDPKSLVHIEEDAGIIATLSSLILWGFVGYFLIKPYFAKKNSASCSGGDCESSSVGK